MADTKAVTFVNDAGVSVTVREGSGAHEAMANDPHWKAKAAPKRKAPAKSEDEESSEE